MKLSLSKKSLAPSNAKIGSDLERKICEVLKGYGFFAHNCINGLNGQPCDIIAIHGNIALLLDCKHLDKGIRFDFKNIQENQYNCFDKAEIYNNITRTGFVIYCELTQMTYFLPFRLVKANKNYKNVSIHVDQLPTFKDTLNERRTEYENNDRGKNNY